MSTCDSTSQMCNPCSVCRNQAIEKYETSNIAFCVSITSADVAAFRVGSISIVKSGAQCYASHGVGSQLMRSLVSCIITTSFGQGNSGRGRESRRP